MARSALIAGIGALALASLALAGCASSSGNTSPQPTANSSIEADPDLGAAWLDGGRMIGIVTLGSSTCVPTADAPKAGPDGVLQVTLTAPAGNKPCTQDIVPRVSLVAVPAAVDPEKNLHIEVTGTTHGQVKLAGVAGLASSGQTDYKPSAGWATAANQFVILTWGSSTCVPVIEDVATTGPAEITVTYQTPDAAQVCTMDMAPRAAVAAVIDIQQDSNVQLILTGGEFDNVKIPIYGTAAH